MKQEHTGIRMTKISSVIRLYATITFLSEISSSNITDSKYHQKVIIFYEVCPYHQENTVLKKCISIKISYTVQRVEGTKNETSRSSRKHAYLFLPCHRQPV